MNSLTTQLENKMNEFVKGQKVVDRYGRTHTVVYAYGCEVVTTGGNFHPTKLFAK